ncbi:MAG: energy transducer TonB [Burkholderiales bacterium]|nr:energy transducer TonB [Burkholderiales bacterium]
MGFPRTQLVAALGLLCALPALAGSPPSADPAERNALRNYSRNVAALVIQDQHYPTEALKRGVEGRVLIVALIGTDGQVHGARLRQSSGHVVLDDAALEKVLTARGLPDPPEMLRGREFTMEVPIIFRIE